MTETALNELQNQIEAIRHEAFAEGYAAAMKAVHELASRSVPQQSDKPAVSNGSENAESETVQPGPDQAASPLRSSDPVRRSSAKRRVARSAATDTRRSRRGRAKRGTNARLIQKILKKAAPRAVRQAEIRRELQEQGVTLAYPSIGHALGQLKARKAAKQVGKSGTWRYSAAA
jgi:hypothetical protein